jgi:hypothetical protein
MAVAQASLVGAVRTPGTGRMGTANLGYYAATTAAAPGE